MTEQFNLRDDPQHTSPFDAIQHSDSSPEQVPGYLSVREAARIIGVSTRSVYGYIAAGKLRVARFGHLLVLEAESVRNYKRQAPGRLRVNAPRWHVPPVNNCQSLTTITVHIRQGQGDQLAQKLDEIRTSGKHCIPGTVARYIMQSAASPDEIQIMLTWRSAIMPSPEEREAALAALRDDLAEILDWETAVYKQSQVVMHA
jgi:excisionase family DNA binding protein